MARVKPRIRVKVLPVLRFTETKLSSLLRALLNDVALSKALEVLSRWSGSGSLQNGHLESLFLLGHPQLGQSKYLTVFWASL